MPNQTQESFFLIPYYDVTGLGPLPHWYDPFVQKIRTLTINHARGKEEKLDALSFSLSLNGRVLTKYSLRSKDVLVLTRGVKVPHRQRFLLNEINEIRNIFIAVSNFLRISPLTRGKSFA